MSPDGCALAAPSVDDLVVVAASVGAVEAFRLGQLVSSLRKSLLPPNVT